MLLKDIAAVNNSSLNSLFFPLSKIITQKHTLYLLFIFIYFNSLLDIDYMVYGLW